MHGVALCHDRRYLGGECDRFARAEQPSGPAATNAVPNARCLATRWAMSSRSGRFQARSRHDWMRDQQRYLLKHRFWHFVLANRCRPFDNDAQLYKKCRSASLNIIARYGLTAAADKGTTTQNENRSRKAYSETRNPVDFLGQRSSRSIGNDDGAACRRLRAVCENEEFSLACFRFSFS